MKKELRDKILKHNAANAANQEAAEDLRKLLSAIPHGQMKQLLKDTTRAAILAKYGFTEVHA